MPSTTAVTSTLGRQPAIAAIGVLSLLAVVWAAAVPRPEYVIPSLRPGLEVDQEVAPEGFGGYTPDVVVERDPTPGAETSDVVAGVLGWGAFALFGLFAAVCLWFLARAAIAARRDRFVPPTDTVTDLDLDALAVAVTSGSSARIDALSAGTPAEGVVAAWVHLEATLHDAGVTLSPSRTATEVTLDALRRFEVDPETLGTLADLYREARWSRHSLTEEDRARAEEAYRALEVDVRGSRQQVGPHSRG